MLNSVPAAVSRLKKNPNPSSVQHAAPRVFQEPHSAASAEKNIKFLIDHQCPQCGAPAELNETDRLFRCTFCKVSSYLSEKGCFRYVLPQHAPEGKSLVYFPYWRLKGMLFSCLPSGIQNRFIDLSRQAVQSTRFPVSVGLRSQALKLRFVSPETEGWFIKPEQQCSEMMDLFLARINRDIPRPILHQASIGESLSLIYAPFYIENTITDAVLNQPVSETLDDTFDLSHFSGGAADWCISFIPTLCPHCGWDMQGRRDALVLHCSNCESLWQASKQKMIRVNVAHMKGQGIGNTIFLPFWRIRADVTGIDLESYADLVRVANLPKQAKPSWDRIPWYFWGPAFKVRPKSFLRLTHQITLSQPRDNLVTRVPNGDMYPVNLPVSESVETLKLNLAGFIRPRKVMQERIEKIQIKPRRYLLIYLPFEVRHHDLVQASFNIAVNRNQLTLTGNL